MNSEEKILKFLKDHKEEFSIRQIHQKTKLSYPTAQRVVGILEAKKKIIVKDLGNIKLVRKR